MDKITAKTSEIIINLGESKKFGPLEIKVLKCSQNNSKNFKSIKQIEKYFILNKFEKKLGSKFWPGPLTIILNKYLEILIPQFFYM